MKQLKMIYTGGVEVTIKALGKSTPMGDGKPVEVSVPESLMNLARDPWWAIFPEVRDKEKENPAPRDEKKEEPVPVPVKKKGGKG